MTDTPPIVTHDGDTANRMHDLLNLFSGLYDWHDYKNGKGNVLHIRNKEMADSIIAEVAELLKVSKEDAAHILAGKANHKTVGTDSGLIFTYDPNQLPSKAVA